MANGRSSPRLDCSGEKMQENQQNLWQEKSYHETATLFTRVPVQLRCMRWSWNLSNMSIERTVISISQVGNYLVYFTSYFSNVKLLLRYCKLEFSLITFTHFDASLEAILDFSNTFYYKFWCYKMGCRHFVTRHFATNLVGY